MSTTQLGGAGAPQGPSAGAGGIPAGPPPLGSQARQTQFSAPSTETERDSGFTVLMQSLIGMGRAGLAGDAVMFSRFRSIVLQVQDIMSQARGAAVAGAKPRDLERQDGVPRPVGATGAPDPGPAVPPTPTP